MRRIRNLGPVLTDLSATLGGIIGSQRGRSPDEAYSVHLPKCVRVESPRDTLSACANVIETAKRGAYLRFGDGDVNLLRREDELLQRASDELSIEMEETFELCGSGVLKALPLHSPRFGIWPGMRPGVHGSSDEWAERLLRRCLPFFIGTPIYSSNALAYCAVFDPAPAVDFLKLLRKDATIFVGNGDVPRSIVDRLFGDVPHVRTPARDSYRELPRVDAETQALLDEGNEFAVIPIAMGCAGRVLAKRLLSSGRDVFCFDFGSLLDSLCGWRTRAWIERAEFDSDRFLTDLET